MFIEILYDGEPLTATFASAASVNNGNGDQTRIGFSFVRFNGEYCRAPCDLVIGSALVDMPKSGIDLAIKSGVPLLDLKGLLNLKM